MKKPEITEGKWLIDDWNGQLQIETENIIICKMQTRNRYKAEQDAQAISAVPEMIDALIDIRQQVKGMKNTDFVAGINTSKVYKALKKAGCTE